MITQTFSFRGRIANGRESHRSRRTVIISGKRDLNRFAEVLLKQANEAAKHGDSIGEQTLTQLAVRVRRSRRFEFEVPLDAKLG